LCILDQDSQNNDKVYINIVKISATVPNDVVPSQVFASDNQNDETTYYNVTDLTSIKVDELKKYIDTKQQNEELKEDYKVCFLCIAISVL
jgi:trehalose-6-phosphatase